MHRLRCTQIPVALRRRVAVQARSDGEGRVPPGARACSNHSETREQFERTGAFGSRPIGDVRSHSLM
eukprot:6209610-Pleurochrysis_carterae.AAC.1